MDNNNEKLKREISKRWPDRSPEARAQLEYILQEAGLLAKPRRKRKNSLRAIDNPECVAGRTDTETAEEIPNSES